MDDSRAVKAVLAVKKVLEENDNTSTVVSASVTKDKFLLPTGKISLIMLQTYDIIARILAHSGKQPGLSEAFMEVMSFEGSEFYLERYPEAEGLTFREITNRTEGAAVAGMEIDGELVLSPDKEKVLSQNSRVLFFTENRKNYHLISKEDLKKQKNEEIPMGENNKTSDDGRSDHGKKDNKNVISNVLNGSDEKVVIIGTNEVTDTVLKELPERKTEVVFAGISEKEFEEIKSLSIERNDLSISYYNGQIDDINDLNELMKNAGHAILLSRHEEDRESDDMDNMLLLLKLRQLRDERGLSFSIAAEMFSEKNRALVSASDPTDFIVANNLSSMVLAQMAEDPNLFPVFHELLSNEGTDLFLAKAGDVLQLNKTIAVRQLKLAALELGWVILGFVDNSPQGRSVTLNPSQETLITPDEQDYLIIIGQQK